uniref:Uncharacterized protein n=1 Tax=candidate division CPR3 bacterium TaxID=2268181 RepID=A0A7C4R5E4_UNCC3
MYQEWGNINGYIAFFSLHKEDQAIPTIMEIKGELSICDKGLKVLELLTSTIEKSLLVKIKKMYEYKLKELGPRGSLVFKGKIKRDSVERKGHSIEIQLKEEKI